MSTTLPPELLQWLVRVLSSEYKNVNRTYSDVATLLQAYRTLSPKTDVYTHETGKSELLLCISGTLPVSFRGAAYNIPIALWVPHEYPSVPPVALVVPSATIMIRPTNHVDAGGRCYHPYLAYWSQNADKSFLIDLCSQLKDVFGKEPPAFARPQPQQQQLSPQIPRPQDSEPHPAPNPPPKLSTLAGPSDHSGQQERRPATIQSRPPPLPPLPQELSKTANPADYQGRNTYPGPQFQRDGPPGSLQGQNSPPPPPPKPERQGSINQQHNSQPPTFPAPSRNSYYENGLPLNQRVSVVSPPQPVQSYQVGPIPPSSPHHWPQQPQSQYQQSMPYQQPLSAVPRVLTDPHRPRPHSIHGFPPQQHPSLQPPSNHAPPQIPTQTPQRPPPQQVPNLLDTNDGTLSASTINHETNSNPPPKPRNPEKDHLLHEVAKALAQRAEAAHARANQSMEQAASQREAITISEAAMERERMELKRIDDLCQKDARILQERMSMAEDLIREVQKREAPNIDAVVVAPTVVHNQLYELVTDDMAIEDTIYVLGKALDRERITLDIFLKHTRTLAREQFLKRALVKKISRQIGLD